MALELNDSQKRAWRSYSDQARRSGLELAVPASDPEDQATLRSALTAMEKQLQRELRKADEKLEEYREASARKGAIDENIDAAWKRLDEACRKIEGDLRSASTVRSRIDEGRRSMMPKVEHLVRERLEPVVRQKKRRIEAELNPVGLKELREELPRWVGAWSRYVFQWVEQDLQREVEIAWSPREGALPISPPRFQPFELSDLAKEISFPEITVGREMTGMASGLMRHGRSALYGVLSLTMLFGVSRSALPAPVFIVGGLGAVLYGYTLVADERRKDTQRLEQELRQKADQATWEAVRVWLDRSQDRLVESVREQLHQRRQAFVEWYRSEVIPRQQDRKRQDEERATRLERLRADLPKIQETQRNAQRTLQALQAVTATLSEA